MKSRLGLGLVLLSACAGSSLQNQGRISSWIDTPFPSYVIHPDGLCFTYVSNTPALEKPILPDSEYQRFIICDTDGEGLADRRDDHRYGQAALIL